MSNLRVLVKFHTKTQNNRFHASLRRVRRTFACTGGNRVTTLDASASLLPLSVVLRIVPRFFGPASGVLVGDTLSPERGVPWRLCTMVLRLRDLATFGDCCLGEARAKLTVVSSKEGSAATPAVLFLRFFAFLAGFAKAESMDVSLASASEGPNIFKRILLLGLLEELGAVDSLRSFPELLFAALEAAPSNKTGCKPADEGRGNLALVLSITAGNAAAPRLAVLRLAVLINALLVLLKILPLVFPLSMVALVPACSVICSSVSTVPALPSSAIVLCIALRTMLPWLGDRNEGLNFPLCRGCKLLSFLPDGSVPKRLPLLVPAEEDFRREAFSRVKGLSFPWLKVETVLLFRSVDSRRAVLSLPPPLPGMLMLLLLAEEALRRMEARPGVNELPGELSAE